MKKKRRSREFFDRICDEIDFYIGEYLFLPLYVAIFAVFVMFVGVYKEQILPVIMNIVEVLVGSCL